MCKIEIININIILSGINFSSCIDIPRGDLPSGRRLSVRYNTHELHFISLCFSYLAGLPSTSPGDKARLRSRLQGLIYGPRTLIFCSSLHWLLSRFQELFLEKLMLLLLALIIRSHGVKEYAISLNASRFLHRIFTCFSLFWSHLVSRDDACDRWTYPKRRTNRSSRLLRSTSVKLK